MDKKAMPVGKCTRYTREKLKCSNFNWIGMQSNTENGRISNGASESEIKWIKLGETIINFKSSWSRHGIEFPICPISKNTFSKPNKSILYLMLAKHNTNNNKKTLHLFSFSRFLNANKTMSGVFVWHRIKLNARHRHGKMNRSNQSQERS